MYTNIEAGLYFIKRLYSKQYIARQRCKHDLPKNTTLGVDLYWPESTRCLGRIRQRSSDDP